MHNKRQHVSGIIATQHIYIFLLYKNFKSYLYHLVHLNAYMCADTSI